MRPITDILHDGMWKGRAAFVVGSGPSLKGFDFTLLRPSYTIGCNEEYTWGPSIAFCQDPRIFAGDGIPGRIAFKDDPRWAHGPFVPVYFKGHPDRIDYPGVPDSVFQAETAHSQKTPFAWGTSLATGLYYGANAGMAALNLAEILGASPIHLLGFDARATDGRTHHHDRYPVDWTLDKLVDKEHVYGRWIKEFRRIKPYVKAEVLNLNPASGIDAFPRVCPVRTMLELMTADMQPVFDGLSVLNAWRGTAHGPDFHMKDECRSD